MPEMPDIEVFTKNLTSRLAGKLVKEARYLKPKRLNVTPEELALALAGQQFIEAKREGKESILFFTNGQRLAVHLMLSGGFDIQPAPASTKFPVLSIAFEDDIELVVFDPRGLTTVNLNPENSDVADALSVTEEYVRRKISENAKTLAKAFLIDQAIIRGIGNAYADEILWHARISPKSVMGKIPSDVITTLCDAIHQVLTAAVSQITAISPSAISGEERSFLAVHVKDRDKTPTGHSIVVETIATKSTYYSDEQRLYI